MKATGLRAMLMYFRVQDRQKLKDSMDRSVDHFREPHRDDQWSTWLPAEQPVPAGDQACFLDHQKSRNAL